MASTTLLTCLCGTVSAPVTLLVESQLPINVHCHCSTCRYTSGSLGITWPVLHSSPPAEALSKLTAYHSSAMVTRYFCTICGCHCFSEDHQYDESVWYCLSGIIEPNTEDPKWKEAIKIMRHDFVSDTIDGGMTPLLLNLNGRDIPARSAEGLGQNTDEDLPLSTIRSLPIKAMATIPPPEKESYLPAKCHCGGVSLLIKRANYGPDESARYVPSDRTKYQTYMCACRSCRLSVGVPLVPWSTLPASNVFNGNDTSKSTPVIFDRAFPKSDSNSGLTLKQYCSSAEVCRTFCSTCGASVSYWSADRPDELDLVAGIFRAKEGSMARRWLQWEWGRCSFAEEATDEHMMSAWRKCGEIMDVSIE